MSYDTPTMQVYDSEFISATLMNQAYDLRKLADAWQEADEGLADVLRNDAADLEKASDLIDNAMMKIADAYLVVGNLAYMAGVFGDENTTKALDYFSDLDTFDDEFLPWHVKDVPLRVRIKQKFSSLRYRIKEFLGLNDEGDE